MSLGRPAAVLKRVHEVGPNSSEKAEAFARAFTQKCSTPAVMNKAG
jgi:hypothetical protein